MPVAWKLLKQEKIRELSYCTSNCVVKPKLWGGVSPEFMESMVLVESMVLLFMDKKDPPLGL